MTQPNLPIDDAGALFQIAEPGQGTGDAPSKRRPGLGVGIDLGTTHSVVAWGPNRPPRALLDQQGRALLPSVVAYHDQDPVVGHPALAAAKQAPSKVIASAKRFLGRSLSDIDFEHPYTLVGDEGELADPTLGSVSFEVGKARPVHPVQVSAQILGALKDRALDQLQELDGVVVTVPAYFDEAQRQATKDACRVAGLRLYRLIAEPTAAALAYGLDAREQGLFAVYDLGGGTFDISVLRLRDGVFQVLATGGDTALGGDDFDRAIAAHLQAVQGLQSPSATQTQALLAAARHAKEALSQASQVCVQIPEIGMQGHVLTQEQLNTCIEPWVKKTIRVCRRTLKDADVSAQDLDDIVLVGGSTRVPLVREAVERLFGKPAHCDLDPDLAVAYGAAICADLLSGTQRPGMTLLDVSPLSLGLETMGGMVEVIIARNSTLPVAAKQTFTNYSQAQTAMSFNVVQGERELARDCRSVASFQLKGLPSLPPGLARVEVTFELDADGLLTVSATELTTKTSARVQVKPSYGLSSAAVDEMVAQSLEHAESDFEARNLAEAKVELGRVLDAVERALDECGQDEALLPVHERGPLREACQKARALLGQGLQEGLLSALREALSSLEKASEPFARRRMESALQSQMRGKGVASIEANLDREDEQTRERRRGGHHATQVTPES